MAEEQKDLLSQGKTKSTQDVFDEESGKLEFVCHIYRYFLLCM